MKVKLISRSICALLGILMITGCEQKIEDTSMLVDVELNLPKGAQQKLKQRCKITEFCQIRCLGPSPDNDNKQVKYLVNVNFYETPFVVQNEKKDNYMFTVEVYLEGADKPALYTERKKVQWDQKMTIEGKLNYIVDIGTIKTTISKS